MTDQTEQPFVKFPTAVLVRRDLTAAAKIVLVALIDRIGSNGHCWPGQRRLAEDCGIGLNTCNRAIRELANLRLITVARGSLSGPRKERTSRYRLSNVPESTTSNVPESTTSNVCELRTFSKRERSRNGYVNVPESTTSTYPNREQNQTNKPDPSTRTRGAADPSAVLDSALPITSALRTEQFKTAWLEWLEYRRQARKNLTPSTVKRQLQQLEGFGHDNAIRSIAQSITNGWIGLFTPDGRGNGSSRSQTERLSRVAAPPGKYAHIGHRLAEPTPPPTDAGRNPPPADQAADL